MNRGELRCAWCGRTATPVRGRCLEMTNSGRTICSGCGRIQLHCSCPEAPVVASDPRTAHDLRVETSDTPYESVGLPLVSVVGRPTHLP